MRTQLIVFASLFIAGSVLWFSTAKGHLEGRVSFNQDAQATRYLEIERELQQSYKTLNHLLDVNGQKKLAVAQEAWQRFKVAECTFKITHSAVELLRPMTYMECQMVMNTERTEDFKNQIQWHALLDPSLGLKEGIVK